MTVAWIGAPLSSAPIYAPKAHSVRGDAGWEGREAPWGERSERAGGGVAPKRRCFGLGVSGTVGWLEKLNNSVKELEGDPERIV